MATTTTTIRRRALRLEQDPAHPLYLFSLTGERVARDRRHLADFPERCRQTHRIPATGSAEAHPGHRRLPEFRAGAVPEFDHPGAVFSACGSFAVAARKWTTVVPLPARSRFRCLQTARASRRGSSMASSGYWLCRRAAGQSGDPGERVRRRRSGLPARSVPAGQQHQAFAAGADHRVAAGSVDRPAHENGGQANSVGHLRLAQPDPTVAVLRPGPSGSTPEADRTKAVITDTSIVKMVEESLSSPSGCLFPFRNIATAETDFEGICNILVLYWTAVRQGVRRRLGKAAGQEPVDARSRHPGHGPVDGPGHSERQSHAGQEGRRTSHRGTQTGQPHLSLDGRELGGHWRAEVERSPERARGTSTSFRTCWCELT